MAAPSQVTIQDLSGKWLMNKTLSDSQDALLSLQGLGWVTRKAISIATVTLVIKQYTADDGVAHVDITSTASGLSSTQENREMNWETRDHADKLFGKVKGQSKFTKKSDFQSALSGVTDTDTKFLLAEKLKNGSASAFLDDEYLQSVVFSQDAGWSAEQLWGFESIDGERRYTRRVVCKNKGKTEMIRLVYDYQGPL